VRVGVTGHQEIDVEAETWIRDVLARILTSLPRPLIGVTSLAAGADQIFAGVVLEAKGMLEVIVPFAGYEREFAGAAERQAYDRLSSRASTVRVLEAANSKEASYLAAGRYVVANCELLVAVWDGEAARGLGGTADVVCFARDMGRRIFHVNPVTRLIIELKAAS
jgi:hypothetical protein